MEVLAVIPARSGSKSVPNKNIRMLNGKPMLAYSIQHAKEAKLVNRIIVSTDSAEYQAIAERYGAEVPFLRPEEISGDASLDIEVFRHALSVLEREEGYVPDIVVQLRPTYPIRDASDIDRMVELLVKDREADSIRCVAPAKEIAYKMWRKDENNHIHPILSDISEAYNMPRQSLPRIFYQNACIDVIRTETILKKNSMSGDVILGYEMSHNFDIDTEQEFYEAEQYLKLTQPGRSQRFVFDIDGVIAQIREDLDYGKADPNRKMIGIINRLYEAGNTIVLFTARGYTTGIDWEETTRNQLADWGLKYHELHFGKPNADFYVDDKALSMEALYKWL